jgi:predicted permease
MSWLTQARERVKALLHRSSVDAETAEEMDHHIDLETKRIASETGVSMAEARRRAAIAFGGVDRHQEAVREARGFGFLNGMSLDIKLGGRMLAKYPGLTGAGVLALAVAVALAACWFNFLHDMTYPNLGLDESDRIVVVQRWDRASATADGRAMHDFALWRQAKTIEDIAVAERRDFAVMTDAQRLGTIRTARVTSAAMEIPRVQPLLGRMLLPSDEAEGSPLAVVLSHAAWQKLFDGDRNVIGRGLRVGDTPGTIVGVMPEGYSFPINQQMWIPMRDRPESFAAGAGPSILTFGRLREGASIESAQAELEAIMARSAEASALSVAEKDATGPRVRQFRDMIGQNPRMRLLMQLMNIPLILFLLVVSANVATLVFARTVARAGEIAVRSALGASRRRLVIQLIAEALVLTSVATAVGLGAASWGMRKVMALFWEVQQETPPFWIDGKLSPATLLYACGLALFAAAIIGGIPALKATGKSLRPQMLHAGSGGSGLRFGAVSTGVIVMQVALCVAFLPFAVLQARALMPDATKQTERFPARDFLTGTVTRQGVASTSDSAGSVAASRIFGERMTQLKARLMTEPGIIAVTYASRIPGFNHPIEDVALASDTAKAADARIVGIDPDFFTVMGGKITAGHAFGPEDYRSDTGAMIADAAWARDIFGARNPIGQRIRFPERKDREGLRWYTIAGVVEGMERAVGPGSEVGLYEPLSAKEGTAQIYIRTTTRPAPMAPSIASLIGSVDAKMSLMNPQSLDAVWRPVEHSAIYFLAGLDVVAFIILAFALIGIYALMSFTVAQRAREIAIRAALGASPRRILSSIFGRALLQITLGVVIGTVIVGAVIVRSSGNALLVGGISMAMVVMGMAGCAVPATRALRIQPTDAMKAE